MRISSKDMQLEHIDLDWLKAKCEPRGVKAKLANVLGVEPYKISKILTGKRSLKTHEIREILEFFDHPLYSKDKKAFDRLWLRARKEDRELIVKLAERIISPN